MKKECDNFIMGLTGQKRCGKDTVADEISKRLSKKGKTCMIMHLSKTLKDIVSKYMPNEYKMMLDGLVISECRKIGFDIRNTEMLKLCVEKVMNGEGDVGKIRDIKSPLSTSVYDRLSTREALESICGDIVDGYCKVNKDIPEACDRELLKETVDEWMNSGTYDNISDGVSVRDFQVLLGTHMRTWISPDFWINEWEKELGSVDVDVIILKDVRMDNEAEKIHSLKGSVFEIFRKGVSNHSSPDHLTEAGVNSKFIAATVQNVNGNLDVAPEQIFKEYNCLMAKKELNAEDQKSINFSKKH